MTHVLSVAYPFAPVGPDAVGGAEQVLSAIDQALVASGHVSTVVAQAGSVTTGRLLPVPTVTGTITPDARRCTYAHVQALIATALPAADIVHLHGIDFDHYLPPPGKPVLVTLHLPPDWYPPSALCKSRAATWWNCVSESQQRRVPANVRLIPAIPNGVPTGLLTPAQRACGGYVLMLGRICPEKGQHLGLLAAHAAGVTALVAGDIFPYPEHQAYFAEKVEPLLDGRRRFLGPAGFRRKHRLLASASCLLVPSLAAETSSLVTMEAMACGTPVIAFRSGALPELIDDGRTGFLVSDEHEMAEAIGRITLIERPACRREAERRFDVKRMTDAYLNAYSKLTS